MMNPRISSMLTFYRPNLLLRSVRFNSNTNENQKWNDPILKSQNLGKEKMGEPNREKTEKTGMNMGEMKEKTKQTASNAWEGAKDKAHDVGEGIKLGETKEKIKQTASNAWEGAKDKAHDISEGIKSGETKEKIKETASNAWEGTKEKLRDVTGTKSEGTYGSDRNRMNMNDMKKDAKEKVEKATGMQMDDAKEKVKETVSNAWEGTKNVASNVWEGTKEKTKDVLGMKEEDKATRATDSINRPPPQEEKGVFQTLKDTVNNAVQGAKQTLGMDSGPKTTSGQAGKEHQASRQSSQSGQSSGQSSGKSSGQSSGQFGKEKSSGTSRKI